MTPHLKGIFMLIKKINMVRAENILDLERHDSDKK